MHTVSRTSWKPFMVLVAILVVCFIAYPAAAAEKQTIRIGSASAGSAGYIHFEACSYLVNKFSDTMKASSFATGGSTENIILLDQKKIDIASAGTLDVEAAWKGGTKFKKQIPIWQVMSWTWWALPMITTADSPITTYRDLEGHSVSLVKKGSGAEHMFSIIMEEYGLIDKIKKNYLSWSEGADALVDGLIVACPGNFPGGKPNPLMLNLASRKPYKALEIDPEIMKKANERNKGILTVTLPKEAYKGFSKDVLSPGIAGCALSTADVDDEVVYEFCKAVFEHEDELHSISKVSDSTKLQNALKWLMPAYPVHPGAAKYYKEKGVWNDAFTVGTR
jgi:uncharacterized protein